MRCFDLCLKLTDLLISFRDVIIGVLDQIDSFLVAFGWQSPEESARTYLVELHEVVINETLVYIFDGLEDDSSLCSNLGVKTIRS